MLDILFEDNHLLAVNKPAGTATMGVAAETESVLNQARQYIKQRYNKPGNVYLGVVSRLDAVVSGVLVFARTSKAAARLSEQYASHQAQKTYWAIVAGSIEPEGELVDWVFKDEAHKRMAVAASRGPESQQAILRYRLLRAIGSDSLVEIELITGRKHQIRLQFAARGHAVRGDRKYSSSQHFAAGIALHARRLVIDHPTLHEPVEIVAELPLAWRRLGISSSSAP
jgi:23S rRNA pseudouridine1911/1915/1917 synthase